MRAHSDPQAAARNARGRRRLRPAKSIRTLNENPEDSQWISRPLAQSDCAKNLSVRQAVLGVYLLACGGNSVTALPDLNLQPALNPTVHPILVVDDNQATAKALAKLLGSANYPTFVALRGSDALAYAQENPVSGAVIDIHLPDINGLVLSKKLREHIGPDKPIVILSGDTSMEVINSLPHVGASYFFSKPINASYFLERLKEWVGKPEAA
jgi:CheY-like chemotaxis protein